MRHIETLQCIEILRETPYPRVANEFVRLNCLSLSAGGEMSGLIAHFLFGTEFLAEHDGWLNEKH